jgi:hypothetical protein
MYAPAMLIGIHLHVYRQMMPVLENVCKVFFLKQEKHPSGFNPILPHKTYHI